jgi:2-C-methyl-D-erythritol 4-phosphate cytidylyltransferase / 2-C-methyl-D-erythritol 2,4-cyclodiphosphate synthase
MIKERGAEIGNIDLTIICEQPRISPYRDEMRARIAEILGISVDKVSVKATTTEGLGFSGRREGIAVQAVASICSK